MTTKTEMQGRRTRSVGKITSYDVYFSGDESKPSNESRSRNSPLKYPSRRRSPKEFSKRNLITKQSQTSETLKWLSENYELIQGVCVPRCVLYTHYLDFCKKRKFSPAGPATFGKLIRQRFPKLTTRRLGTRGQSKYHYYGISIKESSPYYHSLYSGKGLTRFSGAQTTKEGTTRKFCFDKKGGNTLPEFPKASEMVLDTNLSIEKVETFIIMYRTHCQRMLDTIMNANFDEVHKFLLHFWQGMPEHMIPVLQCNAVVDVIAVCDSLLYRILNDILVPSCIQDIPDSLTTEIKAFAVTFVKSLESCLVNTPHALKSQKLQVAKNFVRLLNRNMTFINLAQTARPVFLSYELMSGILTEFRRLDLKRILSELLYLTEETNIELPILLLFLQEFENLLIKQAPIEAYAEWFDNIVDEFVLKTKTYSARDDLAKRSQIFLTSWSFITSRILEELTLRSASTFGSFQLIIMMFEEYILLIIENQMITKHDSELKYALTRHLRKTDLREPKDVPDVYETRLNYVQWNQIKQQQQQQQQEQQQQQQEKQQQPQHQQQQHQQQQPQKQQQHPQQQQQQQHQQQQQPQKQQQQHPQQQQQQLLPYNLQQEILHQLRSSDGTEPEMCYEVQAGQNASEFLNRGQMFHHQSRTEMGSQHDNGISTLNQNSEFPTGSLYPGLNNVSSEYCYNEDITPSVQMFASVSSPGLICGGKGSQTIDTSSQRESYISGHVSMELNPNGLDNVSPWGNSYSASFAKAYYGQDGNHVVEHSQGHIQGQDRNHDYHQADQNHNQGYAIQPEVEGHRRGQGPHQGQGRDQGYRQGQGHYQGQRHEQGQGQLRSHHQRDGDSDADCSLGYGHVCDGYLNDDSERLERSDVMHGTQESGNFSQTYSSLFNANNNYSRKTVLPSFYQLSSHLVGNSQLIARY